MKKSLFLFFSLVLFSSMGQITERNFLTKKFSKEQVLKSLISQKNYLPYPKTSKEWSQIIPMEEQKEIIKRAEIVLKKPVPSIDATLLMEYLRSGDREEHSKLSFGKRNGLMELVIAETLEDKGRFTEKIMNYVWSICEETYWGVPAHLSSQKAKTNLPDVEDPTVDLFGAETAAGLALTDYFVGDKLDKISKLLRARIYYEINKKILIPFLDQSRYGYLSKTKAVNNWNPWIVSNVMLANLLVEKNEVKRGNHLYTHMTYLDLYFNGLGEDAGCDEGPSYWFAAGASAFDALQVLATATDNKCEIFEEPFIQKMASYVYKMHISNDYFVNFADADPTLRPDGIMLYRFGKAIHDEPLANFGLWASQNFEPAITFASHQKHRKLWNLMAWATMPKEKIEKPQLGDYWFKDIEVLTSRNKDLFFAAHGGHNAESHNHNDVGDFVFYAKGEPIIIDAGRGNYTSRTFSAQRYNLWFTQSEYHNLPIINGQGQKAGREFESAQMTHTISDKMSGISLDLSKAYPQSAGIKNYNRSIQFNKVKSQIEINDVYELTQNQSKLQQSFMTLCQIDLSKPGLVQLVTSTGDPHSIKYEAKKWTVTVDLPSTDGPEYKSFKTKWANRPVQRILFQATDSNLKGKNLFTIQ
jgi:hypothetical protein